MATIADAYALALQHLHLGNFGLSEQLCRQILQTQPGHADTLHLLGAVAYKLDRFEEATAFYRQALLHNPKNAQTHNGLGCALDRMGKLDEAIGHYRHAVELDARFTSAQNNLATALQRQKRLDEAIDCYREVLRLDPSYAVVWYNLANAQTFMDDFDEAIRCYGQALKLKPDYAEAHNALGCAFEHQGRLAEAVRCFEHALRFNANLVEAHINLGSVFEQQDKLDEAVTCYQRAIRVKPTCAEAHHGLACALRQLDRLDEAIRANQEAVRLKPDYAEAHNGLGEVQFNQGRPDLAVSSMRQALRLRPGYAAAESNLLFCLSYDVRATPEEVFIAHRAWGRLQEPTSEPVRHFNSRDAERRLRIGYVSPDLRRHAIMRYFEPVLAHHNAEQVEIFCYAEVAQPDAVTARLQRLAHGWRWTCSLNDIAIAELIRNDGIDILVDLAGHTGKSRLRVFAYKPAPVQVTWLGYMNTTGLTAIDYRLTDDVLDPPGQPVLDTEELVRLPAGMCCFAPPEDAPGVSPLPALTSGRLTFGSLNSLFKINESVLDLWSRVLQAVPSARLLMFHDKLNSEAQQRLRRSFGQRGIGAERLDLRQGSAAAGYLGVYDEIDVSLDPFPCTGGVTTCESLWMAVPVLSLSGMRPAGRNSTGLLTRVGLAGWTVKTPEDYVALAAELPSKLHQLAVLRARLRERTVSSICNAQRFTRTLEDTYRTLWRRWCAQEGRLADG